MSLAQFAWTVLLTLAFALYVVPHPTPERDHYSCNDVLSSAVGKFSGDIKSFCRQDKKKKEAKK